MDLYLHFPTRPKTWCLIKQTNDSEFLSFQNLRQNAGIFGLIYIVEGTAVGLKSSQPCVMVSSETLKIAHRFPWKMGRIK